LRSLTNLPRCSRSFWRASFITITTTTIKGGARVTRCGWAEGDALMTAYHDEEWGVPVRDGRALWEKLMLEGFQAGLSWKTILHRRTGFRAGFAGFDPVRVAKFGDADVVRLMADPGIIRARAKIEATIGNARAYLAMQAAGQDFADFAWGFTGGKTLEGDGAAPLASTDLSARVSKELKAHGFKFVGAVTVHAWMQAVGILNDHAAGCFRRMQVGDNPH
jgi:DNA-3-methyladenine glycosylase I